MSFILSIGSVLIAIGVSFLAAYSFSRYRPTGTNFIMFLLLSTRMVPAPAVVLPIFLMYTALGLVQDVSRHDSLLCHVQHPVFALDP